MMDEMVDNKLITKRVVGLKYDKDEGLPRVILKGDGRLADKMLQRQKELDGPPVVNDEKLANALYQLPVDAEIGPELFELVAILLVHVYTVQEQARQELK